jgi:hypothetical protein
VNGRKDKALKWQWLEKGNGCMKKRRGGRKNENRGTERIKRRWREVREQTKGQRPFVRLFSMGSDRCPQSGPYFWGGGYFMTLEVYRQYSVEW